MYHLVYVGVNIGFLFGAASELSFKQSEVPGLVKKQKKNPTNNNKKNPNSTLQRKNQKAHFVHSSGRWWQGFQNQYFSFTQHRVKI